MAEREVRTDEQDRVRRGQALVVCLSHHTAVLGSALTGNLRPTVARTIDAAGALLAGGSVVVLLELEGDVDVSAISAELPSETAIVMVVDDERAGATPHPEAVEVLSLPRDIADVADVVNLATTRGARPMLGGSEHMTRVRQIIVRTAPTSAAVLIRGETGSGKELVARAIHQQSSRRSGPFVAVNCAAIPDPLIESELFGYERGAFTGALQFKAGFVDRAKKGTLFLDEVGDMSAAAQAKLLRLYAEGVFDRVGGKTSIRADIRLIAATHLNLEELIKAGRFREDLFHRLRQVEIWVPPLRARRADIAPLARHFCAVFARTYGKGPLSLGEDALAFLRRQRWPGNVRELEFLIGRMVLLGDGPELSALDAAASCERPRFVTETPSTSGDSAPTSEPSIDQENVERAAIEAALEAENGVVLRAALRLGIARSTLYERMRALGIRRPRSRT